MRRWLALLLLTTLLITGCGSSERNEATEPVADLFSELQGGPGFTHRSGAAGHYYMTEIMGAGVAVLDIENDGDLDLFFVQSVGESKVFRNELVPAGTLRFIDVTAHSGIDFSGYGMGAATGDYNNDGYIDLLVTGYDSRALYRNNGNGTFSRSAFPDPPGSVWSTSAAFFDYDRDGRLDLVILSYVNFSEAGNKKCYAPTGEPDYCTPRAYSPVSARLYHNTGTSFADVTERAGIHRALGPGLGVVAADLNNDGWPDLFVANDTAQNHIWLNQRDGTFREAGLESGAAYSEDGLAKAGMGVALGDSDNDGDEDLFVVNLMREGATLFRNDGVSADGLPVFVDFTKPSRMHAITYPFTGFGTSWFDFDNDSDLDLFVANGAVTLKEEQRGEPVPFKERNLLIRNAAPGSFVDETQRAGAALQRMEVSRGAAFGDLDNDGDVDVVITNNNGPARVLLNNSIRAGWVQVVLDSGGIGNRHGIGARVSLIRDGRPKLVRRVHTDASYCSASDRRVHFGLRDSPKVQSIEVRWPDGVMERWEGPAVNRVLTLARGTGVH